MALVHNWEAAALPNNALLCPTRRCGKVIGTMTKRDGLVMSQVQLAELGQGVRPGNSHQVRGVRRGRYTA